MSRTVAEELVDTVAQAGVQRVYGIVGDSLNPVTDAIRRSGKVHWVHVRHEETAALLMGVRVEDPAQVRPALEQALASSGPALVDVVTDPNVLSMPPKATVQQAKGFALAMTKMAFTGELKDVMDTVMANWREL